MRATWRATSAISMPQASGSSKARRSEMCKPPSTMTARNTSTPPTSRAAGGICSASKTGGGSSEPMRSPVANGLGGLDHFSDRGQRELLEIGGVGHRHVLAGDAQHRRIEPIEGELRHAGGDLGADARLSPALLDGDDAAGLLHR